MGTIDAGVLTACATFAGVAAANAPPLHQQQPGRDVMQPQPVVAALPVAPAPLPAAPAPVRFAVQPGDDFREVDFDALLGEQIILCY